MPKSYGNAEVGTINPERAGYCHPAHSQRTKCACGETVQLFCPGVRCDCGRVHRKDPSLSSFAESGIQPVRPGGKRGCPGTPQVSVWLLLAMAFLRTLPAHAQYPSEQLFLPYVVHSGPYVTNLTLFNPTSDRVSVSFTFSRANTNDGDRSRPLPDYHGDVYRLDPLTSKTIEIGEPKLGIVGQGQLVIHACKEFVPCGDVIDPNSDPLRPRILQNFNPSAIRKISVSAEYRLNIFAMLPTAQSVVVGTVGDSMLAVPWYKLPGTDGAIGMDRVQLSDIRSDGHFSTRVGLNNASMYSATILTAILRDGAGVERGRRWAERLEPMVNTQHSVEEMFGVEAFATNRLNRTPALTSGWIEVQQTAVTPNEEAALTVGCESGCPRFYAWASVTDRKSGDFSLVQPVFETVNQSSGVAAALKETLRDGHSIASSGFNPSRNQARSATSEVIPPCSIVVRPDNLLITDAFGQLVWVPNIRYENAQGGTVRLLTREELMRMPPEICGPTHVETVVRRTGAAQ